jgi:hypothetical protein
MKIQMRARRALDLRVPIGCGYELRLVERPGSGLDAPRLEQFVSDLREVADRCVPGGHLRYGVLSGSPDRLRHAVVAVLYERSTRRPVGFNAMTWFDGDFDGRAVLHAGLCMIEPGARRCGLLGVMSAVPALLAFVRNRLSTLWVTNVTQVPAVAGLFARAAGDVYPSADTDRAPSQAHRDIATEVMRHHRHVFGVGADAKYDAGRFVIRNAYTGGSDELKKSYAVADKHRDSRVNHLCRELLDYERGDDLLQVGKLTVGVIATLVVDLVTRVVKRQLRRRSRPSLARAAVVREPVSVR